VQADDNVLKVWGIFLGFAYLLTLAVLPILFGVIRAANRIARDSSRTLPAAIGIMNNAKAVEDLRTTETVGSQILSTAHALVDAGGSIEVQL
jgi:hypothetical protein